MLNYQNSRLRYQTTHSGGVRANKPIGLITGIPADVFTKYVSGSGVGTTSTFARRAKLRRAIVCKSGCGNFIYPLDQPNANVNGRYVQKYQKLTFFPKTQTISANYEILTTNNVGCLPFIVNLNVNQNQIFATFTLYTQTNSINQTLAKNTNTGIPSLSAQTLPSTLGLLQTNSFDISFNINLPFSISSITSYTSSITTKTNIPVSYNVSATLHDTALFLYSNKIIEGTEFTGIFTALIHS